MRHWILLGIMSSALPLAAWGATYTICPDGSGDYLTIQAGINASAGGDVLELCDGTFVGDGNRDIDYLGKAITVRSHSGNAQVCIVDCGGPGHRGFHFHSGEGGSSVLEGVTIANGEFGPMGGGILCDGASPTINDCIVRNHLCTMGYGAGMCANQCAPTITGCRFINNGNGLEAGGGGLACLGPGPYVPVVTECVFEGNRVQGGGGGVLCMDASPSLTRCTFSGNVVTDPSGYGGGIFCYHYSSPTLRECVFEDNSAYVGGGITGWDHCDPSLTECRFSGNSSVAGGGAFFRYICLPLFDGCTLANNDAMMAYPQAGAGGALNCDGSSPILRNCTLVGNEAAITGGGLHLYQSSPTLEQTIIAFSPRGESIYCSGPGSTPTLSCCDVHGNAGGDWVGCIASQAGINGNIALDPMFCDIGNEDYGLQGSSPCAPFTAPNPQCDLIGAWPVGCSGSDVDEEPLVQAVPSLEVSPNPCTSFACIRYALPGTAPEGPLSLDVFDAAGRLVRRLVASDNPAPSLEVGWDGKNQQGQGITAGIYFAQLRVGTALISKHLIIVR